MSEQMEATIVGFFGWLALLLIGLKLGGVIDWSWVWILSPLWGPWTVILTVIGVWLFVNSTRKTWKDNRPS